MMGSIKPTGSSSEGGIGQWAAKQVIFAIFMAAALFLSSGRLDWVEGWFYLGLALFVGLVSVLVLMPRSPDRLAERSRMKEGTKVWDKGLSFGMAFSPVVMACTAGLERRFTEVHSLAVTPLFFGTFAAILGALFTLWAMATNRVFSGTVRIQRERGQTTVTAGPYRYVRHPGYLGSVVFTLTTPLILGSVWTLVPAVLTVALTFVRTKFEDDTLQQELEGYREYTQRLHSRLLPGIW
jgi:protein-S-isoprenylcysteine O-methyltransferase Ste14